jgi:hypothetical protein
MADTIDTDEELDTAAPAAAEWPPERIVYRITDRNVHDKRVQEQLAWVPGNKVLIISRRSVKELETRHAIRFFEACGADREAALTNVGRVIVLVDGYDDDRRELWQIPQVRRFFDRLWRAVPHMLFFLLPEGPPGRFGSTMFLISLLHPGPRGGGPNGNADGTWELRIDRDWAAWSFLEPGFAAMNAFAMRHGIDPDDPRLCGLAARINKALGADLNG